jgi:hypothetical protein
MISSSHSSGYEELYLMAYNTVQKVNQCFEGKCRLHLQCHRIHQVRNQNEADSKQGFRHYKYGTELQVSKFKALGCQISFIAEEDIE